MRVTTFCVLLTTLVGIAESIAAEDVYRWVDKKGLTHYGAQPPKNVNATKIKTRTGHSEPVNYGANTKKEATPKVANAPTAPAEDATANFKDPERCAAARKNLETLRTHPRVRAKGEDGEIRVLTPDEHSQKIKAAEKAIEESC